MKKNALNVHEKSVARIKQKSSQALSKFRQMEQDVQEANAELHEVVMAIDVEMDKLAALRIQTTKEIATNETVLQNLASLLGKEASR